MSASDGSPDYSLFRAVDAGDQARVARALAAGGDPNGTGPARMPLLFIAAGRRNAGIVRALIKAGADVNVKFRGVTLLAAVRALPRGERNVAFTIGPFDLGLRLKVKREDDGIEEMIKLLVDAGAR